jgi:phenylalanyl-tRNA synthetase beta chain
MRQTLLLSGLETIAHNLNNKNNNLKLFEFGKTYHQIDQTNKELQLRYSEREKLALFVTGKNHDENWIEPPKIFDIYFLKNFLENLFHITGISFTTQTCENETFFMGMLTYINKEKSIARLAQIDHKILKHFDIKKQVYYAEIDIPLLFEEYLNKTTIFTSIATTPSVKRDLALVVEKNVTYQQLEKIVLQFGSRHINKISLFDVYEGTNLPEGKKQYALNFVIQHPDKTLTEDEINKIMNKLLSAFEKECGATLR